MYQECIRDEVTFARSSINTRWSASPNLALTAAPQSIMELRKSEQDHWTNDLKKLRTEPLHD